MRSPIRSAAVAVTLGVAAAQVATQPPEFRDPGEPARGIVLDEDLGPIAGARVALVANTGTEQRFGRAIADVLRKNPLPITPSQRDGTFVLPIAPEQQLLGAAGEGELWLVVAKDGYHPWREPLFAGMPGYLGSRVLLRRKRKGDPFAAVPWPPADEQILYPWLPLPHEPPAPIAAAREEQKPSSADLRQVTLRLRDGAAPVKQGSLLFGNTCYGASDRALPTRFGEDAAVRVQLPFGRHEVRVAAPGFLARIVEIDVDAESHAVQTIELTRADVVDVLAEDVEGRPVPFTLMSIVSCDLDAVERPPFNVRSDSAGRVRFAVSSRDAYFAYSHFGLPSKRILLAEPEADEHGVVHVPQRRPVTIVIRGDDLPERGTLRWAGPGGEYFRGFWCKRHGATAVVTRAFARDHAEMWAGGYDEGAPVVIRLSDLPPAPRDPLLDLAVLDRHTRRRASVVLASSTDSVVRGLAVRPAWQAEGLWHDQDLMSFQRRVGGKVWQLFHADNKGWSLWARDDHAYELRVTASGHQPAKVTLPARDPAAAEPPELAITLTER